MMQHAASTATIIKIATVATFEAALERLLKVWEEEGKPKLIRIEGFEGVGKSGLAQLFCERTGAAHINGDAYITKPETEQPYRACIRQSELDAAIGAAVVSGEAVVLEAVCLEEIAPSSQWGRGFVVYVKRLSFNN
jgi:thymidylate kinase